MAQIPASIAEWWWCRRFLRMALPVPATPVSRKLLLQHASYAVSVAGISALWLLASQIDKIVMSRILVLDDYGRFSLGVHMASVVALGVASVHGAVLPRMTRLVGAGMREQARSLYGVTTALTVATSSGIALALGVSGDQWIKELTTGTASDVDAFAIGVIYTIGQAGLGVLSLAYLLQSARGNLRLHGLATVIYAVALVAIATTLSSRGAFVVAVAVACTNWLFAFVWLPIVHGAFLDGGHLRWVIRDLAPSLTGATLVIFFVAMLDARVASLWLATALAILGAVLAFVASGIAHAGIRHEAKMWWDARHARF